MKPFAKKGLMVIGVLYTITVATMVTDFAMEGTPTEPAQVSRQIQKNLNVARKWAYERDPKHIRATEITEQEASQILGDMLTRRGTIINVNFTLAMQGLNFAILLLVLYGWLWDPMLAFLDKRRSMIRRRLDEAAASKRQAGELLTQRQQELAQLRKERGQIIEQAQNVAEQEREQMVERARGEAERMLQQAQERLSEEVRRARLSLREEVAEFATRIAARVLQREVSRQDHDRLVEQMVEQMTAERMEGPGPAETER